MPANPHEFFRLAGKIKRTAVVAVGILQCFEQSGTACECFEFNDGRGSNCRRLDNPVFSILNRRVNFGRHGANLIIMQQNHLRYPQHLLHRSNGRVAEWRQALQSPQPYPNINNVRDRAESKPHPLHFRFINQV